MLTISLHKVLLTAPIGIYPQEKILFNKFEIDIDVQAAQFSEKEFIDYTIVHQIITNEFANNHSLLETLAIAIHKEVKKTYPFIHKIKISIRKLNPPMQGVIGAAQVCYEA